MAVLPEQAVEQGLRAGIDQALVVAVVLYQAVEGWASARRGGG